MDTKAFKRALNHSENYYRNQGFGQTETVAEQMQTEYESSLIKQMRANSNQLVEGDVTIYLAESFGFCWGVERAIMMAYEARSHFPDQHLWITNEIIHNPEVNQQLKAMNVSFIELVNGEKDFSAVGKGDVVILPAFGASVQEMKLLHDKGCTIVDTTCPWVSKVWNTVEKHKKREFTSIIHGKYKHEETVATSSFAGKYLVVLNLDEAQYVADYILQQGTGSSNPASQQQRRQAFLTRFANAYSEGFDPDTDLAAVGIANQTTMLKGETEQIGKLFERTMLQKYGPLDINEHFHSFNTICDATQERQDAMFSLVDVPLDLIVVIGGFNSSNTTHLQEIAVERNIPSFHIDSAARVGPGNRIEHKPLHSEALVSQTDWLPSGRIAIGVTSGASTPDKAVQEVIEKIFEIKAKVGAMA
jgi:4-hydroxy-3-methylbut-2-en-1-yl diphosphate reductase